MINTSLNFFINSQKNFFEKINDENTFLTYEKKNGVTHWKIRTLNNFQVRLRNYFGLFSCTHSHNVATEIKKALKGRAIKFDDNEKNVKGMLRVINLYQNLQATKDQSDTVSDEIIDKIVKNPSEKMTFKNTMAYLEQNRLILKELKALDVPFKIKSESTGRLAIRISKEGVMINTKKNLGAGTYKKVKTAFNIETRQLFARSVSRTDAPTNFIAKVYFRLKGSEISFMQKLNNEGCSIRLHSSYEYMGTKGNKKSVMLMDMADGDLSSLISGKKLEIDQQIDIARQLLDTLVTLSKHNIWHRDIKPGNFLYFKKENNYNLKLTDYGVSVWDSNPIAHSIRIGTEGYMDPIPNRGKQGDVYAMGKTLKDLFFYQKPKFIYKLIQKMTCDSKKRLSAEEAKKYFDEKLKIYLS